eukprot:3216161-Pleurochrysis_carterae.AAC.1
MGLLSPQLGWLLLPLPLGVCCRRISLRAAAAAAAAASWSPRWVSAVARRWCACARSDVGERKFGGKR